ncbi:MAG: hypothetical protein M1830_010549 [Pleopsidium flavum]|nr:MAG: hypothetical protein M1830_010549 [Pleopsidium flavum]
MALPPEHIHIKRRRDDEPVDSLYIHTENLQKRRRFTEFLFRRVQDDDGPVEVSPELPKKQGSNQQSQRAVSGYSKDKVPIVRATLPGDELLSGRRGLDTAPKYQESIHSNAVPIGATTTLNGGTHTSTTSKRPASPMKARDLSMFSRRFHLKKSASAIFPYSQGPTGGIQKRKKGQKPDVAVFVERARELKRHKSGLGIDDTVRNYQALGNMTDIHVQTAQISPVITRKRPNPSAVEKQWRAEQWGQEVSQRIFAVPPKSGVSFDTNPSGWDRDSIQLAEELQRFAVQQTDGSGSLAELTKPASNLRHKPKVPSKRHQDTRLRPANMSSTRDDGIGLGDDLEDEGEYVYDTYVRQPSKPSTASYDLESMHLGSQTDGGNGKIGVLVITEEDEEIWETYAEEEDSDKDWNSEEEDENAEDYHANDYPEDEVDSDDEFGQGTYSHRRNASDEEEYDKDTGDWSDDGDDMRHPWKNNAWNSHTKAAGRSEDEELTD